MSFDAGRVVRLARRLDKIRRVAPGEKPKRPFLAAGTKLDARHVFDTTVYVDALHGKAPRNVAELLDRGAPNRHLAVCIAELIHGAARLDAADPRSAAARRAIWQIVEEISGERILAPDGMAWALAGVLSGRLAALLSTTRDELPRLFNDCLIHATASRNGLTLLTRNHRHFDLLRRLWPQGRVLFYDTT